MSWSSLDQRVFPRLSTRCDISIHDRKADGNIQTQTQNLGAGGVCVISERSLEKLSQVHLHLAFSESERPIDCDGRVVWVVRSKAPRGKVTYDIGIQFLNLPPEDEVRITNFIQTAV